MGSATSRGVVPVMSEKMTVEDLAGEAEKIGKSDIAGMVREHQLDGAAVNDIAGDDEALLEIAGNSKLKLRLVKAAIKQLQDADAAAAPAPTASKSSSSSSSTVPTDIQEALKGLDELEAMLDAADKKGDIAQHAYKLAEVVLSLVSGSLGPVSAVTQPLLDCLK